MRFPKEKKVKVWKMSHCLRKLIRQIKNFAFIVKTRTLCEKLFEENSDEKKKAK
jgi:hypothetical protein